MPPELGGAGGDIDEDEGVMLGATVLWAPGVARRSWSEPDVEGSFTWITTCGTECGAATGDIDMESVVASERAPCWFKREGGGVGFKE